MKTAHAEIIGYIHVCQIGKWTIPFDMIMNSIKESGLYDKCREIRIGVANDRGTVIPDTRFNDPKILIIAHGPCSAYERLTLHKMREHAEIDGCQYWYAHTKGIKHFDNNDYKYECVIDWIKLMIYWNFTEWYTASEKLLSYDSYGCEYTTCPKPHYSGNFWWANSYYLRTLPKTIGPEYCDPEFWILNRDKMLMCNIYSSGLDGGDHYSKKSNFFPDFYIKDKKNTHNSTPFRIISKKNISNKNISNKNISNKNFYKKNKKNKKFKIIYI
jgi:hypothetical protein